PGYLETPGSAPGTWTHVLQDPLGTPEPTTAPLIYDFRKEFSTESGDFCTPYHTYSQLSRSYPQQAGGSNLSDYKGGDPTSTANYPDFCAANDHLWAFQNEGGTTPSSPCYYDQDPATFDRAPCGMHHLVSNGSTGIRPWSAGNTS